LFKIFDAFSRDMAELIVANMNETAFVVRDIVCIPPVHQCRKDEVGQEEMLILAEAIDRGHIKGTKLSKG